MAHNDELIAQLYKKLEQLYKRQAEFYSEISALHNQIKLLEHKNTTTTKTPVEELSDVNKQEPVATQKEAIKTQPLPEQPKQTPAIQQTAVKPPKQNLEKRIGENIINKVGIAITVIGVAIGAKYSIENNLISPVTRIILGYIAALLLLGFGLKLRKRYHDYSAVLVSGAIVILYFITFFAYSLYSLIPQIVAFVLMLIFTVFTVVTALSYNKQLIAHIGLVGAYAIPFLLSNNNGRADVLFSYMGIINLGILVLSFKRYWKSLFYSAFGLTWLIYVVWLFPSYDEAQHFALALIVATVFYIQFYVTAIAYKLIKKEVFNAGDIIILLLNAFIFYGLGYWILNESTTNSKFLGVFTLANALIHFVVSAVIYKKQLADKKLFYLTAALVLVFVTLAAPVQLDGNWVTLLWLFEAVILFWIGIKKQISIYEKIAYVLIPLVFFSLFQDYTISYFIKNSTTPLLNIQFLTSLLCIGGFGYVVYLQQQKNFTSNLKQQQSLLRFLNYFIPSLLIIIGYFTFRFEIENYFNQLFKASKLNSEFGGTVKNYDLRDFKTVWVLNYSMLFISGLSLWLFKKGKNSTITQLSFWFIVGTLLIFLVQGLYVLSDLRESYFVVSEYYNKSIFYILIRYIAIACAGFMLFVLYLLTKQQGVSKNYKRIFDIIFHTALLWILSSELLQWLAIFNVKETYKLGLSILWALYSFVLISFGIMKTAPYLRIAGLIIFGVTLLKLFFYDIAHLSTISKTIAFVSLGVLLLIISYLYQKFKTKIIDANEDS